jgi:tRNA (cytidine/uridine-2'-O-)-methyltransferase
VVSGAAGGATLHVVLVNPEIAPNTGNVIRLCANTGARLHLIEPLGFALDDAKLRRAGLDYREYAEVETHASFDAFVARHGPARWFAYSTRGGRRYDEVEYRTGDALVFGRESAGLGEDLLSRLPPERRLRLPMRAGSRSLNLSNAVAVAVFEAWRQLGFEGGA